MAQAYHGARRDNSAAPQGRRISWAVMAWAMMASSSAGVHGQLVAATR
jgi:hypothetical protein